VAISVVAASMWMMENPARGVCVPDELPHDYILGVAKPYLGNFISKASDWTPLRDRPNVFRSFNRADLDRKDPWQFKNFLVTESD
jgi:homospermidine synthase